MASGDLPGAQWIECERHFRRFEAAWQGGAVPALEDFLPVEQGEFRETVMRELVHLDLEFRLRAGLGARVEDYLSRYPQLRDSQEILLELIEEEYALRQETDGELSPTEYAVRFPPLAVELSRRLSGVQPAPTSIQHSNRSRNSEAPIPQVPGCEILEVIGRGGMGVVYKARHLALDRMVAVKMLRAGIGADDEDRRRFQNEVRAAALLQHPNIIQIHEVGAIDGQPYCLLEYLPRGTLQNRLAKGPIPANDAAQLLEVLARAIHFAHQRGIIHRDLKPANILLKDETGQAEPDHELAAQYDSSLVFHFASLTPKIADFGLAKQINRDSSLTATGAVIGTPQYMAPEQADGRDVGPATDIYSLGAILYEMLTGRPPFQGVSPLDTFDMLRNVEPVRPSRLQPRLPPDLETICLKCLHKEPTRRYPSAEALADDLKRFLAGEPIHARPIGIAERTVRWCCRKPAQAALIVLLAVVSVGVATSAFLYQRELAAEQADDILRKADARRKRDLAEQQVGDALQQARQIRIGLQTELAAAGGIFQLLNAPARWSAQIDAMRAALDRANVAIAASKDSVEDEHAREVQRMTDLLRKDDADRTLALYLEKIRQDRSTWIDGKFDLASAARDYPLAFASAGYCATSGDECAPTLEHAELMQQSPIREQLLAALDDWAFVVMSRKKGDSLAGKLLAVARNIDPHPWRDRVRDPAAWRSAVLLERIADDALANEELLNGSSPQILEYVGSLLHRSATLPYTSKLDDKSALARRKKAEDWLRQAQMRHPADFWLNFQLGSFLQSTNPREAAGFYRTALAVRLHSGAAWNNLGSTLRMLHNHSAAMWALQKSLEVEPKNGRAWSGIGLIYYDQKNYSAASTALKKSIDLEPDSSSSWNNLGMALQAQKELKPAIHAYEKSISLDSTNPKPWFNLGNLRLSQRDYSAAMKSYRTALEHDPRYANAWRGIGDVHRDQKNYRAAIDAYQQAIECDSDNAFLWYRLGNTFNQNKQPTPAIHALRKATEIDPNYADAWTNLGNLLSAQDDPRGAINAYKKATEIEPSHAIAWNNLSNVLRRQKDLDGAIEAHKKATDAKPTSANYWYNFGVTWTEKKNIPAAIDAFNKAVKFDPKNVSAWNRLARILENQKDLPNAVNAYRKAIVADPAVVPNWVRLGACLLEQGDLPALLATFQDATKRNPKEAPLWYHLGVAHRRMRNFDEAIKAFQTAMKVDPKLPNPHLGIALVYRDQGRFDEAAKATDKGIGMMPLLDRLQESGQVLEMVTLRAQDKRLPKVLAGDPATAAERLSLADLCQRYKSRYRDAVQLYLAAFAEQPSLADNRAEPHRINAARAALLAVAGKDADPNPLDEASQAKLRGHALAFLQAELAAWREMVKSGEPADHAKVRKAIARIRMDPEFVIVRDRLPSAEQASWRQFWADVLNLESRTSQAVKK